MRRWLGRALIGLGMLCLGWYVVQLVELSSFQRRQNDALNQALSHHAAPGPIRRVPYQGLVGRLEIPRVHLSAMVIEGDDDATLKKAVGHLPDTPLPWEQGNAALAGHRDSFFRPLMNVRKGDEIRLTSPRGTFVYRVREMRVTGPSDVRVLARANRRELTLLTCYPFNFIGSAPKRYVIKAEAVPRPKTALTAPAGRVVRTKSATR